MRLYVCIYTYIHTYIQTDRQTDRQTGCIAILLLHAAGEGNKSSSTKTQRSKISEGSLPNRKHLRRKRFVERTYVACSERNGERDMIANKSTN